MISALKQNFINYKGWKTKRRIVVFESDDWGSVRMPSKKVFEHFVNAGIPLNICPYNSFDSLESPKDFDDLFNVITNHKDQFGNLPIITGNIVVANPNFERILESDFSKYYYEPFIDTYLKNENTIDSYAHLKEGINNALFYPQFHGREHVNVSKWFRLLQNGDEVFRNAFDHGFWGIGPAIINYADKVNIQASYDAISEIELEFHRKSIEEGLKLFEQIFKFKSETFIANNFIWHPNLNQVLNENGVQGIQGMKYQLLPIFNGEKRQKIRHFVGEKNKLNQVYSVRNCSFEPSVIKSQYLVSQCLNEIANSFFWGRPAVISVHRLNFIGSIVPMNRENNLRLFNQLLKSMLIKWPDLEFMHSAQLANVLNELN